MTKVLIIDDEPSLRFAVQEALEAHGLDVISAESATAALSLIDEVDAITEATGLPPLKYASLMLAASRGEEAQALFEDAWWNGKERGEGSGLGLILWLTALRHNAHGRADARNMASFEVNASALVMKLIGPPMVSAWSCWRALISV